MGHAVLGRRRLGALYAGIVTTAFVVGLSLHGQLYRFDSQHPLSLFAALTSHATGLLNLTACWMRAGEGDLRSATFEYGTTYLLVAGVMNLLLMLDAFEIARGRKR